MESYAILGWGVAGRAVYRYLSRLPHADIRIYLPEGEYPRACAEAPSLHFIPGMQKIREAVLVRSPGIRPDAPFICEAIAEGARLTSETELFIDACPAPILAVTGSDGKTTTVTLAAGMLEAAGHTVHLGGNIGVSLLDALEEIQSAHRVVLELSSFQLMDYTPALSAAAVTNLSENHLNWHRDMAEYRAAKLNILRHARHRVVNARLPVGVPAHTFSAWVPGANYHVSHDVLMHGEMPILPASAVKLHGWHNIENILCAAALTQVETEAVVSVATTFTGVRHRMSCLGVYRGITCYDSSIDTTPSRTAATLAALPHGCTVICGGAGKRLSYAPLAQALCTYASHVVFTGEAGEEMQTALIEMETVPAAEKPAHVYLANFASAVETALTVTPSGGTLVLSPAATSFDAFTSYEERGNCFRRLLEDMKT